MFRRKGFKNSLEELHRIVDFSDPLGLVVCPEVADVLAHDGPHLIGGQDGLFHWFHAHAEAFKIRERYLSAADDLS